MPSQNETFYNLKRLHLVFAVSSLALLAVTLWMLAADHGREWKVYQRTYRDRVEPWLTKSTIREEQTEAFQARDTELTAALKRAQLAVPSRAAIEGFCKEAPPEESQRAAAIQVAYQTLAVKPSIEARQQLLSRLDDVTRSAKLRRDNADRRLRFRRADLDEARSTYEVAVGEGKPQAELDALQTRVDQVKHDVDQFSTAAEEATSRHETMIQLVAAIMQDELQAQKALADHHKTLATLQRALSSQQPGLGKRLLRLPLIDAFGRPLAIQQIWLPDLTINYSFRQVARFDRCTTCHQAIDKTVPGSPSTPACLTEKTLVVKLHTPKEPLKPDGAKQLPSADSRLQSVYGLSLAPEGILEQRRPTIGLVLPLTAAAKADLWAGDVIAKIDNTTVSTRDEAIQRLLNRSEWGKSLSVEIRRGLPPPYRSHPRLDLYVGSSSPHPAGEFGCTICHAGQGSATSFKFASHTPSDPEERVRWQKEHGWFWNHDWGFPMQPSRFVESSCLKCHHDVVDLEPTRRFPDPPAPRLLAGYHLVRQNGCFACHEIKGITASGERIGPDMRLEPNYHEAAQALLANARLNAEERSLAEQVVQHPEQPEPRRQLVATLGVKGDTPGGDQSSLVGLLAAEDPTPGTMRKVGPSLREMSGKLDRTFVNDWTSQPSRFRPESRMPQFFGQYEHLEGQTLADTRRLEAVEVQAVTEYLMSAATPVAPLGAPQDITEPPSVERGKKLFEFQGCLACHKHKDFPEGLATQGPNLSDLSSKLTTPAGARWLASWLRDPTRHSPRTLMPNPMLTPVALPSSQPIVGGEARLSDPAADLAAYLLSSHEWQPKEYPPLVESDLDALALQHLSKTYPKKLAEQYLKEGIPATMGDEVQGDALELVGPITLERKIRYVGRRTILKRGCYGCHDIPGFETAPLIGPALSDWGRKQESLLAFEQVHRFLAKEDSAKSADDGDTAFFKEAVLAKRREGFIWQKLGAPRSFDYKKAQNKGFNEQLLMGRFAFSAQEREAILTFVLGLVAEPPAEKYVAKPDRRRQAIVEGRKVLDKYGCALCHTMEMERWAFQYDPAEAEEPAAMEDFAFLAPTFSPAELAASAKIDRRGLGHAEVVGMPRVDAEGKLLLVEGDEEDENGAPLPMASFTLWEPAAIDGQVWRVGGAGLLVYQHQLTGTRAPWGGDFARLLYPKALADAKASGTSASEVESWGWGPPPLVHEGSMVQPGWLYEYLLEPSVIRPAAVLRMPKYNLSTDEAGKLVDYFAAASGAAFPYSSDPRSRSGRLENLDVQQSTRFDQALRLITDRTTYCAKCHLIGDFSPGGENRTVLAPNLDQVSRRIRPEYVRRWLANPKSVLPYTAMPVNFPPSGDPMGQDLYLGSSLEQLEAVTDLLLNYDDYMKRRTSIRALVEQPTAPKPARANGAK